MKEITINQKNGSPVIVLDNDKSKLNSYTKKLSEIFQSSTVSIFETTTASVIIRPNQISSILVTEKESDEKSKDLIKKDDHIDIVTDGD